MRRINIYLIANQVCLFRSCFNGGSCLPDTEKQTFSCSCLPSWTGDRCEVRLGSNYMPCLSLNCGKTQLKSNYFARKSWRFDKSYPSLGNLSNGRKIWQALCQKCHHDNWKVVSPEAVDRMKLESFPTTLESCFLSLCRFSGFLRHSWY